MTNIEKNQNTEWLVLRKTKTKYVYCRYACNETIQLKKLLMQRYNIDDCVITPSGMSAISSVMCSILCDKTITYNIILGDKLYCDTPELIKKLAKIFSSQIFNINVTDNTKILKLFGKLKDQNNILFVESCSNPNGFVMDLSLISQLRKLSNKFISIVDNTWITSASYNPFHYGVDYVVTSLTKYYSAGNAIAGAVLSNAQNMVPVFEWCSMNGLYVSPFNAGVVLKNIQNIDERFIKSSNLTLEVIDKLKKNKDVIQITHPALKSHISYSLASKLFKYYPSVFTFTIKASKSKVIQTLANNKYIENKTSFGSEKSRFNNWPEVNGEFVTVRLAVGYNDNLETIMNGLDEFIKQSKNV